LVVGLSNGHGSYALEITENKGSLK
jgi:hypothetical protein